MPFIERFDVEHYKSHSDNKPTVETYGRIEEIVDDFRLNPDEGDMVAALNYGDSCQIDFADGGAIIVHRIADFGKTMGNPGRPADWWVEYYDRVGEHGSHQAKNIEHAVWDATRFARHAKRYGKGEEWYVGIYDYNNNEGTVYWATREYLDLLKKRAPERGRMDEFMNAVVQFLETGKPAEFRRHTYLLRHTKRMMKNV